MGERITPETDGSSRDGHEFRYHLAAGFLSPGDVVVDAACGGGYGAEILQAGYGVTYFGVDRDLSGLWVSPLASRVFMQEDLTRWAPDFSYDVWVGFETIEHLDNYAHYLHMAKQARKWICVSVPVIPTVGINPWHKHDFRSSELPSLIEDEDWRLFQGLGQPSEFSEIYVFKRI
jgi:hypothetical protein